MGERELMRAYRRFKAELELPKQLKRRASAPLLVKPVKGWFASSKRLLIIGQETKGWSSADRTITSLEHFFQREDALKLMLHAYSEFNFATNYPYRNSPFWRAFRMLSKNSVTLWTNMFRCDVEGSVLVSCSKNDRQRIIRAQRPLLREEIAALDPTAVLFLTGPRYDSTLYELFEVVTMRPLWSDIPEREAALVTSASLPKNSIRFYHPAFLQRSHRWPLLERLINLLDAM